MKNLIFLCVASCIFILSVIVLNYAPTINGLVGRGTYETDGDKAIEDWADFPCNEYSDLYNYYEDESYSVHYASEENKKYHLELLEEGKNNCLRKKAMIGLEYSAFNINVIFGFICAILGVLLYSGNKIGKILGLIGLASGAIGFVLTLVYVIYSGIIFNNDVIGKNFKPSSLSGNEIDPYNSSPFYKATESDGAFAKWEGGQYVCIFYDKDNKDKFYRKYSSYGSKNLNYRKTKFPKKDKDDEYYKYLSYSGEADGKGCRTSPFSWSTCKKIDEGDLKYDTKSEILDKDGNSKGYCEKLYYLDGHRINERKNLYNSWVTTIVFGCFIFVLDAVLAVFGFLVYKDSSGTSGAI